MQPTDPIIRDREAAAMIGASVSTFGRRVQEGMISRPIKSGGMSRWRQSEIEAVIARAEAARSQAA